MSNYYAKQEGKARIAEELIKRGWKVYDYSPAYCDQDPGCDYPYHAAHWVGLAEKNGFVLCVDIANYNVKSMSGKAVYKYTENNISSIDYNKIEALKNMTQERGATANEEANAKAMIEKIYAKAEKADMDRENSKVLDFTYPTFQEHPTSATKWHLEKDNSIYDKGNGLTTFAKIPDIDEFDIDTMTFTEDHKYYYDYENCERIKKLRTLSEDQEKAIKAFKNFILRIERAVNSMNSCGDGTKETEEAGKEQQSNERLIKVTEKVTKKVLKMVEITDRKEIKVGDYLTMPHHGHYWKVTSEYMQKGTWKGVKESRKAFVYEIVGSASRGYQSLKNPKSYYQYEYQLLSSLEEGKTKIFELKEVEETQEVEKWVRQTSKKTPSTKKAETKANNKTDKTESDLNTNATVTDESTEVPATRRQLWALHCATKLDTTDLKISKIKASELISKSKNGESIIEEVEELLNPVNNNTNETDLHTEENINTIADESINNVEVTGDAEEVATETTNNNSYDPESIEQGFIYNCHFKAWNYSIDEIHDKLTALNINYYDMGEKVGFENVDYFTMILIQELNNENQSILFIDSKVKTTDSAITDEDCQTVETLLDYSVSIMEQLQLNHSNYAESQEYKTKLVATIKQHDIKITKGVLNYLVAEGYGKLEKVLKDLLTNTNFDFNNAKGDVNRNVEIVQEVATDIISNDNSVNYSDPEVIQWEKASSKYIPIEFNNMKIIDVLDKNIFVNCLIPSLNKNCNKVENDKEIKESSYLNKFLIQRIVKLNLKQYKYFINNLLHDYSFLTGLEGWAEDDNENLLYYYGVAIVCDSQETLIIDPECSSFAKYTCQLVEDIENSLQTELNNIHSTVQINNNLYNEAMNSIINDELYELKVSDKIVIADNRYIKNIPHNGLIVVTGLTIRELINDGIGIDILNLQPLRMSIESFKQGLRKHDNKEIFSLFPTEIDKQIENIKFLNRLEHELNRARIKENNMTKIS